MTLPSETFDRVAQLYDRARPSYPESLFTELVERSRLPERGSILEIGAGTGQATRHLAQRGFEILCLEPGEQLARLAATNLRAYPNVSVRRQSFEAAQLARDHYAMVFAAQAFHWVPREIALIKTAAILAPGGTLAAFWNSARPVESETRSRIDEAYRRHAPGMPQWQGRSDPGYGIDEIEEAIEDAAGLEHPWKRSYRWSQTYGTTQYLELLQTHSDHQLMPAADREVLLGAIGRAIDDAGGTYEVVYDTLLFAAFRRA